MRFYFDYAIKPSTISQPWGVFNQAYEQFFPGGRHNGVDFALGLDRTIYAPLDGTIIRAATRENGQWQPNGGGIFCGLLTDSEYIFDDGKSAFVLMDFLHCDHILVKEGDHVVAGQPIAIQDNTGFSTGPHTHIQFRREIKIRISTNAPLAPAFRVLGDSFYLKDVDSDQVANGSFDPAPYYTGKYAVDVKQAKDIAEKATQIVQEATSPEVPSSTAKLLLWELVEIFKGLVLFWKGRNKS